MALTVEAEFQANHNAFKPLVVAQAAAVHAGLAVHDAKFLESYKLVSAFRAWHEISLHDEDPSVAGFFIEAHNDLLTSHVLATGGMWRSALISLRSFMEGYLAFIFFRDHAVELRLWSADKFRIEPKSLRAYCVNHPDISKHAVSLAAAKRLDGEYSKLSGSVHGAKVDFRMTTVSDFPAIATADAGKLGRWLKLERDVVRTSLLLLIALHSTSLQGASYPVFRRVIGACLAPGVRASIKQQLKVNL